MTAENLLFITEAKTLNVQANEWFWQFHPRHTRETPNLLTTWLFQSEVAVQTMDGGVSLKIRTIYQ